MEEILKAEKIYFGDATICGIPCKVGYEKKFRWQWAFTQLNTFIFIGKTEETISKEVIEAFSSQCLEYALRHNRGWPRGFHSGIAAIAILEGNNIENEAIQFCENLTKQHVGAFEVPVLYDSSKKKGYRFDIFPVWGRIYGRYLAEKINTIIS